MKYKKQSHALYYTRYHIVISTKYRSKVLKKGMREYLKRKVRQVSKFHPEIEIIKFNTDIDHAYYDINTAKDTGKQCGRNYKNKYRESNEGALSFF